MKEVAFVGAVPASGICKGPGRYAGLADKDVFFHLHRTVPSDMPTVSCGDVTLAWKAAISGEIIASALCPGDPALCNP